MNDKEKNFEKDLEECLIKSKLENFAILILHIRLKKIKEHYDISYNELTKKILDLLEYTKPKNIIVPTFTYSFTNNKTFNKLSSRSEVGLFSEIFRLQHSRHRTNDPIFSFCHKKNFPKEYEKINFNAAFINNSIWEYFYKKDVTIVNIGLDHLIISLIHYIEFICNVPYRKIIKIKGTVELEKIKKSLIYNFYARDKKSIYALDWIKIEADLIENNIIKTNYKKILNFKWLKTSELGNYIKSKIKENPYYLVKKITL